MDRRTAVLRRRRPRFAAVVVAAMITSAAGAAAGSRIEVVVDPRVELMSLIFRLAGNPEYNQANSASPYADDIETHFGQFRSHEVVKTARRLRRQRGVSYDAVMSMAVHLQDTTTLALRIPLAVGLAGSIDVPLQLSYPAMEIRHTREAEGVRRVERQHLAARREPRRFVVHHGTARVVLAV